MTEQKPKSLAELIDDVLSAQAAHDDLYREAEEARKRVTSALNRLNEAQKRLDEALDAMRKNAPRDSDWRRRERESEMRPA